MMILDLVFGFLLVFAGRDLFWLCVGIIGFLIGVQCAASLGFSNGWTAWVSAFALGSVGVVLAMSFEWVTMIFGVGFLGGGYLSMSIFSSVVGQDLYVWPVFVVGGIVGMCLLVITFDWALITISSLLGAILIINAFHVAGGLREFLFISSMVTGICVQYLTLKDTPIQKIPIKEEMMLIKEDLQGFVQEKLGEYLFVVVSNRQPYEHVYKRGKIECQRPSGGVSTALDPVMQACHGLWIAASSGEADHRVTDRFNKIKVPENNPTYTLKRVWLNKQEEEGYYYGYSNDALWPLCHTAFQRPFFKQEDWQHYINVNEKFAKAVMEEVGSEKAFIWIQDYHFCLLPKLLKDMAAPNQLIIAHFWHIPWPSYEAFRICPQKNEILEGMLANDMIGFHTHYHCNNFLEVVDRQLESKIDRERFSVIRRDHETLIRPYPISVDFEEINQKSQTDDFEKHKNDLIEEFHLGDCQLLLGVDRIDYTKGIPERLIAIDCLLEKHPELKEKVVFLQVGVLSRIHIGKYKALNDEINALVERINWRHSTDDWSPVIFIRGNMPSSKLLVLYRMARVCIVSALHDGMNLVAKEFVCSHCDEDGVLLLSQFAGSARELTDAMLINPYDSEQFSDSIYQALIMPEEERRKRMIKMRQIVHENNIFRWAGKFLSGLLKIEFKEHEEVMA